MRNEKKCIKAWNTYANGEPAMQRYFLFLQERQDSSAGQRQ
jgi:hypothetical protein